MLAKTFYLGALLERQVRKIKERSLNLNPHKKERKTPIPQNKNL